MILPGLFISAALAHSVRPAMEAGWVVERWGLEDGLPLDHFTGMARTPDGMIWLSSYDGLIRFDGQRFTTYRPSNLPGLPSSRLPSMAMDDDGRLWLVTEQGDVAVVEDGVAKRWSAQELGCRPSAALRSRGVWIVGDSCVLRAAGASLERFADAAVQGAGLGAVFDLVTAPDGGVWIAGRDALLLVDARGAQGGLYTSPPGRPLSAVTLGLDGVPYVGLTDGIGRLSGGELAPLVTDPSLLERTLCALHVEPDGALRVMSDQALWRIGPDGSTSRTGQSNNETCLEHRARREPGDWRAQGFELAHQEVTTLRATAPIRAVVVTPEGTWAATSGDGLYQIRPSPVQMLETAHGGVAGVIVTPSGDRVAMRLRDIRRFDQGSTVVPVLAQDEGQGEPFWLDTAAIDAQGRAWFGGDRGACALRGEVCVQPPSPAGPLRPLVVDGEGALWVDTAAGLGRTPPGQGPDAGWSMVDGHEPRAVARVGARLSDGTVVVAVDNVGVIHYGSDYKDLWTGDDHLGVDKVRDMLVDPEGLLWLATVDGGLCRLDLRGDRSARRPEPRCITRSEGLPSDTLHSVSLDAQGRLWMSTNQGIFYVARREVEAALAGDPRLSPLLFDERDGMADREANGTAWPTVGRAPDGKLYFPIQGGVALIDPSLVAVPPPPQVRVESVAVGGLRRDGHEGLSLTSDQRDVSVTWTAAELRWPEQLRFRYRLRGYSEAWSALGSDREASWTNLPPGEYTFEVEAALGGSWSASPAVVRFTRAPAFVETAWFPVSVGVAAMAVAAALAWRRSQAKQAQIQTLEEEVRRRTAVLAERNEQLAMTNEVIAAQATRLAELDTLKSAFVSNLSHELRTPLTLVLGPLEELLERPETLSDRQRSTVNIAQRNGERLRELVQQLFDVARLETGGLHLRARPQDLGATLRRVASRFTLAAAEQKVQLTVVAPEGVVVWFDADLIDKAVSNLLGNALKFTESGGRIDLELAATGEERVEVTVRDTGVGIPLAEQAHIFERFYQVDGPGGRPGGGAGIGLSLARDLVELHGGAMSLQSELRAGSVFRFTLPLGAAHLRPEEVDLSATPEAPAPGPTVEPRRAPASEDDEAETDTSDRPAVLVVEDHADLRAYITTHLSGRFQVSTAENGRLALAEIRSKRPDVVVSDVMMPLLDGISLCREIRAEAALADLPVILISAKGAEADRKAGLEVANAWFSKPFRMRELIDEVTRLAPARRVEAPAAGPGEGAAPEPVVLTDEDRRLLERLNAHVTAGLADPDLSVASLARRMAMSRRQLLREVSRLTGQPVVAYIQRVRMETARDLLRQTPPSSVSEVASAVGMNRAYFSRLYSAWFGHAPSDERQSSDPGGRTAG